MSRPSSKPARKTSTRTTRAAKKAAAKAPAKKVAKKPAKKAAAKKSAPKNTTAKRTKKAPAKKSVTTSPSAFVAPPPRVLRVVRHASEAQALLMAARNQGKTIGFVPTMGALHLGHAALLDEARKRADIVVVSIFVNPTQFGANEDLSRYPRPFEADVAMCDASGVDIVFAPGVEEIYPPGFDTRLQAGALADDLEGASRHGHFDGVLTVVNLLLQIVQPHFAVFGEKDFQQLALVKRMVRDLRMPVEIVAMPVIRDTDGLALSSRNVHLSRDERVTSTCLYRAIMAAQDAAQRGVADTARLAAAARAVLESTPGFTLDYVVVRDAATLRPVDLLARTARVLVAGKLGAVRLIDNGPLFPGVRFG
jgi:pantoate--beta-alanine ligase